MAFSKSGKKFSIFNQKQSILKVFDSTNIDKCFDHIENDTPVFEAKVDDKDSRHFFAKILEIDIQDKYVLVSSKEKVFIYLIENMTNGEPVKTYGEYKMDTDKYEEILDVHMDSGFNKKKFYRDVWNKEMP